MIKNVIFDLDGTIIKYEPEDALYYKEVLRKLGYDENDYIKVFHAIDEYENILDEKYNYYNKEKMLNFINSILKTDYPIQLIDEINRVIGTCWIKRVMLSESTIAYLSQKYHCFVFSNWFESVQKERLKKIGYLSYFEKVLGADNYGSKPYASAYQNVLKTIGAKPEECIMIGDLIQQDIWGANKVGMKAILFNHDDKRENEKIEAKDYRTIRDLRELEQIL